MNQVEQIYFVISIFSCEFSVYLTFYIGLSVFLLLVCKSSPTLRKLVPCLGSCLLSRFPFFFLFIWHLWYFLDEYFLKVFVLLLSNRLECTMENIVQTEITPLCDFSFFSFYFFYMKPSSHFWREPSNYQWCQFSTS